MNVIIFFRKLLVIKYPGEIIILLIFIDVEYLKVDCFRAEVGKFVVEADLVIARLLDVNVRINSIHLRLAILLTYGCENHQAF